MNGSKFVPSIKNIVREICISSCEGKYPYRDNAKLFFLKSQRGRLRVQWKQCKLNECKRIFPGTCKPEISDEMDRIVELLNELNVDTGMQKKNSFCACQKCRLHLYPFNEK